MNIHPASDQPLNCGSCARTCEWCESEGLTLRRLGEFSNKMLHSVETEHEADEVRRHHEEDVDHTASCCYVAVP